MAVIVSSQQNEIEQFREKGLEIKQHRERMVRRHGDQFKTLMIHSSGVCMCHVAYGGLTRRRSRRLPRQANEEPHAHANGARANRVFPQKHNGLIVDYVGVFRNLEKALATYGASSGGGVKTGDCPVEKKKNWLRIFGSLLRP